MSFYSESLQNHIAGFLSKNKKLFIYLLLSFIGFIGFLSINNMYNNSKLNTINNIIIETQDLEQNHKLLEAYTNLKKLDKYNSIIKSNRNMKYVIDLYKYKLLVITKQDTVDLENTFINNNYKSQYTHFANFSEAGEKTLDLKMYILFKNKEYDQCINLINDFKMQKTSHFISSAYKAKALILTNKRDQAMDFLVQIYSYSSDFSQNNTLKEIIKLMIFNN